MTSRKARLLDTQDAAEFLGLHHSTLERWRREGTGPDFVRVGFKVRYTPEALAAYLTAQTQRAIDHLNVELNAAHGDAGGPR